MLETWAFMSLALDLVRVFVRVRSYKDPDLCKGQDEISPLDI